MLWAINPLRVEPVARVTDLAFCLLLCFLLLSLWCYLRAWADGGEPGRSSFYWCSVAAFALAMLSYPFAFAYGVVLLVLDWYPLRRFAGCAHWWRDAGRVRSCWKRSPSCCWAELMLTTIVARLESHGHLGRSEVDSGFAPFERAMQAFYVWAYYAWKPWLPFHLSPVYTTLVDFNPNAWPFWLSAALVDRNHGAASGRRRQWPWALALWGATWCCWSGAGTHRAATLHSDRYDYLPGLVWAVAIAAALRRLGTRPKLRAAGMVCAARPALLWGALSVRQTRVWQNSVTLFKHMIRELGNDPYRSDIHWRLGAGCASQGKTQDAVQQYQTSLRSGPPPIPTLAFAEPHGDERGSAEAALTNCLALLAASSHADSTVQGGRAAVQPRPRGRSHQPVPEGARVVSQSGPGDEQPGLDSGHRP